MDLFEEVRDAWSERDETIERAMELRHQRWEVPVPEAWKQTAETQHSSLPKKIAARVTGTMTLNDPVYYRSEPGDDQELVANVNQVERALQAKFQYDKRTAVAGKDAWYFLMDNLINKGAVCAGSIFAPHSWAGVPAFMADDKIDPQWWRDGKGVETADEDRLDYSASSKAYMKQVEMYRRIAKPPIIRRILPPEQCYPLFVGDTMLALFISRPTSSLELAAGGFELPRSISGKGGGFTREMIDLIEVVTPNRIRYFYGHDPIRHKVYGDDGVLTRYGIIPFSYRVGLDGGELEYGQYGEPLLALIDTQLRMIDTLLTYQHNSVHLASFPSFKVKYTIKDGVGTAALLDTRTGKAVQTYQFKSGTIMDFGPDKDVEPFVHPGLNKDFYEFVQFLMNEINDLIPPTLSGIPASSGFNTVQSSVQAKAIINPIATSAEMLLEDLAVMDLQHVRKRVPGPIYLNLEVARGVASRRKGSTKVMLDAKTIGDYYQVGVSIDREVDRITLSGHLNNLKSTGAPISWASILDAAGFSDPEDEQMKSIRDEVYADPEIRTALKQEVIDRFGLKKLQAEAKANGRITVDPNTGVPLVRMPDGSLAGPAGAGGAPQAQGPAGATLGGANLGALAGAPNLSSTNNPGIALPAPTAAGRPRGRRRGGALPGGPQLQGLTRPTPSNPAAP
ncbi:MAG: hypothetical protein NUW01_14250 [Gemmatimonadaceae bacterium]|nr:hypothetical protein [Gemmatimonadaceae bacterium]